MRKKFRQTGNEVAEQFGGGAIHPSGQGFWWDRGFVDWDELSILEVDIPDTEENRNRY